MGDIPVELAKLLQTLLPGFLTAWILYGLTAYKKPPQFERVIQALVFTGIIQALAAATHYGVVWYEAKWTPEWEAICPWAIAFALGLIFSWCANRDSVHHYLRKFKFTVNTSYPSQWFSAFAQNNAEVILNMKHERRLRGFPLEWPDHPDEGHFHIGDARWLLDDGSEINLDAAECVLVPVGEVELVEFLKCPARPRWYRRFWNWIRRRPSPACPIDNKQESRSPAIPSKQGDVEDETKTIGPNTTTSTTAGNATSGTRQIGGPATDAQRAVHTPTTEKEMKRGNNGPKKKHNRRP